MGGVVYHWTPEGHKLAPDWASFLSNTHLNFMCHDKILNFP